MRENGGGGEIDIPKNKIITFQNTCLFVDKILRFVTLLPNSLQKTKTF
jgi:hypothetical protein